MLLSKQEHACIQNEEINIISRNNMVYGKSRFEYLKFYSGSVEFNRRGCINEFRHWLNAQ